MFLLVGLLALPACSLFDNDDEGHVTVKAIASQLLISNQTSNVVYYAVYPRDILPVLFWGPCSDPALCTEKIQSGRKVVVKYDDFSGERGEEAVVFWWHLVEKPDGEYAVDEIREIVVKL